MCCQKRTAHLLKYTFCKLLTSQSQFSFSATQFQFFNSVTMRRSFHDHLQHYEKPKNVNFSVMQ
ncbi:hypothetical protein BRADI_1g25795v3 [Brachypodium distachyon]|uniref:Uncharacterized protein n=1 Tax=Brachypodium distachyon TaxID=15368 RepID=A0A2K2DL29_BRADI|nr:hypothetical protein BRADI_1g25795v3 [Brachypodium distachyon]